MLWTATALYVNLILFDTVSISETDKGISLFSNQDIDECHIFLRIMYCEAAQAGIFFLLSRICIKRLF